MSAAQTISVVAASLVLMLAGATTAGAQPSAAQPDTRRDALKQDVIAEVEDLRELTQQIVDSVFGFSEIGFQEFETQRYLTAVSSATASACSAAWPAFRRRGSRPGEAAARSSRSARTSTASHGQSETRRRDARRARAGAPGHGEGHNAGPAVVITAAIAAKSVMMRERLPGTLIVWPGVAEELLAAKAHFVRAGVFKGVDAVLTPTWIACLPRGGATAGAAASFPSSTRSRTELARSRRAMGRPQRSRRGGADEHRLELQARALAARAALALRHHHGGDQPNVVPPAASVWYYFRETDYKRIKALWEAGNAVAPAPQ